MRNILAALLFLSSVMALAAGPKSGGISTGTIVAPSAGGASDVSTAKDIGTMVKVYSAQAGALPDTNQIRTLGDVLSRSNCEEQICEVTIPEPREHLKFGVSFIRSVGAPTPSSDSPAVPKDCNCLVDKLKGNKTDDVFNNEKKTERDDLNNKILTSYGKKFVNSFAANMEDMSFFLKQSKMMFTSEEKAIGLQCNNAAAYNAKINQVCGRRGITDRALIENRKNLFINAVSGGNSPFDQRLPVFGDEVLQSIETPDFNIRDQLRQLAPIRFSRVHYDQTRMNLATTDPEAKYFDMLMGRFLTDPDMNRKMTEALNTGITPVEAYIKVINENKASSNFFSRLGFQTSNEGRKYLSDDKAVRDSFKFMMQIHPGIQIALTDRKAFQNLRSVVKPGSGMTFLSTINATQNVIEPILVDRCNKMVEEFANAVCTKDEDLIATVDPVELELLLHPDAATGTAAKSEPDMHDLLICEARIRRAATIGGSVSIPGGFGLGSLPGTRQSDYIQSNGGSTNGSNSPRAQGGLMGQMALTISSDPRIRSQVVEMINQNDSVRRGFDGPGIVADRVYATDVVAGRDMRLGRNSMSKEEASQYLDASRKYEESKIASSNGPVQGTGAQTGIVNPVADSTVAGQTTVQPQTFTGPPANTTVAPNYAASTTSNSAQAAQAREQLRQYMAEKNDPIETNKAVNALDDASAQELNRLRNERQAQLEQQLKEGEQRLKDMRTQLADVSAKANVPVVERDPASAEEDEVVADSDESSSNSSSGRGPRTVDQRPTALGGGSTTTVAGSAATSGAESGSQSSKSSSETVTSNTEVSTATVNQGEVRTTESGSIVITAADVKSSANLPQQELNQEVQKFLATSDLSSSSIQDIKSKGIKIRFNVMENNKLVQKEVIVKYENLDLATRNQIDLKLARKNVQNQVSKLSVLRMLIKQNKSL